MNDKEQVYIDFVDMVKKSWTYARMTDAEKENALAVICFAHEQNLLSGNYQQRWRQLLAINNAHLVGIGYNGGLWREPSPDAVPAF